MIHSDVPVSRRRRKGRTPTERGLFLRFAFLWIASLVFLALAWYERTPAL